MSSFMYPDVVIVEAYGKDCFKYLQSKFTNDLTQLNSRNPTQINALCNPKGRVIALFFTTYKTKESLLFGLPVDNFESVLEYLEKYAIFSKIKFKKNNSYKLVYNKNSAHNFSKYYNHTIIHKEKFNIDHSLLLEHVEKDNICNQLPMINRKNTGKFLPAELNLDSFNAISYEKGCFLGQEIIARMKYLGKTKKYLKSILIENNDKKLVKLEDDGKLVASIINQVLIEDKVYILALFNKKYTGDSIYLDNDIKVKIIH